MHSNSYWQNKNMFVQRELQDFSHQHLNIKMPNTDDLSVTIFTMKNMKPSSSSSMLEDADDSALDSPVHHRVGRINVDLTHDKDFAIYTVPTKMPSDQQDEIPKKVIDTRYLNDEDLIKLKLQDPFLY